jgi:retron-type reverse transcriptase
MTLTSESLHWAVNFLYHHSDGDLFPKVLEIDAIYNMADEFVKYVENQNLDLDHFKPGSCRRFIVPKDELAYRQATQLDPQDSIILSALIYQYGQGIENRRLTKEKVFSYRFKPDSQSGFYDNQTSWNQFWTSAYELSNDFDTVLYCDIADFYNQIYHHTVENQLIASGFSNQAKKWIINLIESTTAKVSRGIPIGPHALHLIAESTMIPIDNCLVSKGINFIRFADDIVVFCKSRNSAKQLAYSIASTLDKQQRLTLQKHKTRIYNSEEFKKLCLSMIEDRPISSDEDRILKIIRRYSDGNPYIAISFNQINDEDWLSISDEIITRIIKEYLDKDQVDYIRLRWFYRRLTQIGHPGAVDISLQEIENLSPCLANICVYFTSVQSIEQDKWVQIGERLLSLLNSDEIKENEYLKLSLLSLFTKNEYINHFSKLTEQYASSDPFVRREILLAAKQNYAFDWLRDYKENYQLMDPWQKNAYLYAISGFPQDEKEYFIKNVCTLIRPFEKVLAKWVKKKNNSC